MGSGQQVVMAIGDGRLFGGAVLENHASPEPDWADQEIAESASSLRRQDNASKVRLWQVGALSLVAVAVAVISHSDVHSLSTRMDALSRQVSNPGPYRPPADLDKFIASVERSVVVIECKDSQGSGWVIDLGSPSEEADAEDIALDKKFPTEVITNHHVIEECVDTPGKVKATAYGRTYDAWLYSWDIEQDLALVAIKQQVPALDIAVEPMPGYWVMAVGTPYGLEGTISMGNVMNTTNLEVISSAPLNSGNSGGPLVNSRGRVVGINSWVGIGSDHPQDWNGAMAIPALCVELVDCSSDPLWTWGRTDS